MIWTTIELCMVFASLLGYWKNVSNPRFLPTSTHTILQHITTTHRPGHSAEAALRQVIRCLFFSLDKGSISSLDLLEFSSVFDTVDHSIHQHRVNIDFGFTDAVLQRFASYLTDRTHYVSLSSHCSALAPVHSGVPQGSIIGPMFFTMHFVHHAFVCHY